MQTETFRKACLQHICERKGGKLYADLKVWAREELMNGSRVKASHIDRVAERMLRN